MVTLKGPLCTRDRLAKWGAVLFQIENVVCQGGVKSHTQLFFQFVLFNFGTQGLAGKVRCFQASNTLDE